MDPTTDHQPGTRFVLLAVAFIVVSGILALGYKAMNPDPAADAAEQAIIRDANGVR
jgi:hypothetical protein